MEGHEYPTARQLKAFRKWHIDSWKLDVSVKELIDYIESLWWMSDWGFKLYKSRSHIFKKQIMILRLDTGGWSGNESIIGELKKTFFWGLYWQKSIRGGHYWFEIPWQIWIKGKEV